MSPGAQVWIDGAKTTQTGGVRLFSSPPIDADREYSYEIRARWTEGGQEVDRSRKVSFHAGDRLAVNMMKRSSQDADASPKHETLTPALPRADEGGRPASRAQDLRRLPTAPTERKPVEAADKNAHDGKVISITEDKLVMTGMDEKEHTHALTADVKMTCDKQVCKWDGIKAGMKIRVTTKKDDSHTVTTIEALDKRVNFEKLGTF